MACYNKKTEGGHKRGNSNMCHRNRKAIVKQETRRLRRINDQSLCRGDEP